MKGEELVTIGKNDLLNFLMEHTDLKGFDYLPVNDKKIDHGPCCVCSVCGHWNDECVCYHNEILDDLHKIIYTPNNKELKLV